MRHQGSATVDSGAQLGAINFVFALSAPVKYSAGYGQLQPDFQRANRLNVYYAIQQDFRHEPPATDGNSFPNEGDQRGGRRQLIS